MVFEMDATGLKNIVRSKQIVYKVANDVAESLLIPMAIGRTWLMATFVAWPDHQLMDE
jgi:hypothetical protein